MKIVYVKFVQSIFCPFQGPFHLKCLLQQEQNSYYHETVQFKPFHFTHQIRTLYSDTNETIY